MIGISQSHTRGIQDTLTTCNAKKTMYCVHSRKCVPEGWLMTASVKSRGMPATEGLGCPLAKGLSDFSLYGDDVSVPEKGPCSAVLELSGYAYVSASSLGSIDHHQASLILFRTMATINP